VVEVAQAAVHQRAVAADVDRIGAVGLALEDGAAVVERVESPVLVYQ